MPALQIRDVPDEVRDQLVARARALGQSLQSYLLTLVTEDARRSNNRRVLERFSGRADGTRLSSAEAQELRDIERAERDSRLS
jgi:hypothetical protein